jgi:hypothetical protein
MTGLALFLTLVLIYCDTLFEWTIEFFKKYEFIKDFSFLITIFLIPLLYLTGHLINTFDYLILKYFIWLHDKLKNSKYLKWWRDFNEVLFYRHRIVYQVVKHWKSQSMDKAFTTTENFWVLCAKLQKDKTYDHAGYWYILNDLFKAINVVFSLGIILAIIQSKWSLVILFLILGLFSYLRARQFAKFFRLSQQ